MTSPVDTSVKFATAQMVGAGALVLNTVSTSGPGTIINILDSLLVNGWDAVTPSSIVVAGGVATVTFAAAHSCLQDAVILVSGVAGGPANFADLNGEQKVTLKPNTTTATFACPTVGNGTCTGTLGVKMAGCGWSKPFSATGKGVYKSGDPRSFGFYYRMDETAANNNGRTRGYEVMTDVDTGNGLFPVEAQTPGGGYWVRAYTNGSAVAIDFLAIADGMTVYWWARGGQTYSSQNTQGANTVGFGDLIPYSPRDMYASFHAHGVVNSQAHGSSYTEGIFTGNGASSILMPRSYTGLGGSVFSVSYPHTGTAGVTTSGMDQSCFGPYPDSNTGKLRMSKRMLVQTNWPVRGEFPGIRSFPHSLVYDSFQNFSVIQGDGADLGRRFMVMREMSQGVSWQSGNNSGVIGAGAFDLTGPWR